MSEPNPFIKSLRESSGMQLSVLFGCFFVFLLVCSAINVGIEALPIGDKRDHALWASVVQSILAFSLPAYCVARFSSFKWAEWLKLTRAPRFKSLLGVVIVYVLSLPAMEWLIEWNKNIHFPESMAYLEQTLRSWEENSEKVAATLLSSDGIWATLAGVLVIGVLTGFSEELFFRGGIQGIFSRTNVGTGMSVWIAALIFSAMHFQFFGFIPRLIMGVFFGYLLVWTRSLWVPIFAHALNNSIVVITAAITKSTDASMSGSDIADGVISSVYTVGISLILTVSFLIFCRKEMFFIEKHPKPYNLIN